MAVHVSHAALPYPIKNARFSLLVPFIASDGTPTDPTTPDTELSGDNGSFVDTAEEIATATGGNGMGLITLSGAETNYSAVGLAFKVASGPKPTLATLYPRALPILGSGTLSAGSAGGGTLGTVLMYDLTGCFIRSTGGTAGGGTGGANNQARRMITYNSSTGAFTVAPNWEVTPDNTTTYDVLLPEGVTAGMLRTFDFGNTNQKIPDSVSADGAFPSAVQALYEIRQFLFERAVSSTTVTIKKPDGSTSLMTFTLNDGTAPTSITRTT